jgi:hypothetical protein
MWGTLDVEPDWSAVDQDTDHRPTPRGAEGDEGGDPPCWAHLFEEGDEAQPDGDDRSVGTQAGGCASLDRSGPRDVDAR